MGFAQRGTDTQRRGLTSRDMGILSASPWAHVIRLTKRTLLIFAFLLCAGWAAPLRAMVWQVQHSPPFTIYYHPQDSKNLPGVLKALNQEYPVIRERLGLPLLKHADIYIAPTLEDFFQLSQVDLPAWATGYSIPERQMMVLKSPTFGTPLRDLSTTAVHELVHLELESDLGDVLFPTWLNEGLAVTLSGEGASLPRSILSWAILSGRLLTLFDIDHVMGMSAQDARLAYLESTLAVDDLRLIRGWEGIRDLLNQLKATGNFDSAMVKVYGIDEAAFEYDFLKKVRQQYRWAVLADPMFYVTIAFVPLLGLAGIMVWRKKRRIMKEWEEQQPEDIYWGERNP